MSGSDILARPERIDTMDAQVALIGSMVIDDRCVPEVMALVSEDDFTSAYRSIFRAIRWLWEEGCSVDPITVVHQLGGAGEYRRILMECMEVTPTAANAGHYAKILREQSRILRIRSLAEAGFSSGSPSASMIS